jgi:hypothetical protein
MVVCIEPDLGLYFRINTEGNWQYPVKMLKSDTDHAFLKWDSHLECGEPLELDDYCIEESLTNNGGKPIGRVSANLIPAILSIVANAKTISADDKDLIRTALLSVLPPVQALENAAG